MTVKEKKRILKEYNLLDERIEQMRRDWERSHSGDTYNGPLGNESVGGKPSGTVVEVAVEKRAMEWEKLIKQELSNLYDLRVKIEHAIHSLTNGTEQLVVKLCYLGELDNIGERRCLKLSEIALRLHYSERQIQRIHKAALMHLPDIE